MWRVFYGSQIIGDPRLKELALLNKKLTVSLNQTGSFEFTMMPDNPYAEKIELLQKTDEISVEQDGVCLFRGRAVRSEKTFDNCIRYWCEGDRAYLNDAQIAPYTTGEDGVPNDAFGFFTWLVNQYNDSMNTTHRFTIGDNQGDQLGKVDRQSSSRSSVWSEMKAAIVDGLGGYVRTRHLSDMRIIDLLASGENVAEQRIRFGENLMDFTRKVGGADYCTRVYATGGTPEKENRDAQEQQPITLNSLGSRDLRDGYRLRSGWIIDSRAEKKYGVIEASHTFEGVLDQEKLMEDALRWLSNVKIGDTIEMTALDLAHIDPDAKPIYVGDYVRATSRPHGFDEYFICVSRSYDLDHPENDTFILGSEYDTLTGAQSKKLAELNGSINTYVDYLGDVKDLADSKAEVFLNQPTKYNKGDLWVLAPQDGTASQNILVATVGSTGGFNPTNWNRASDYTNNDAAAQAQTKANQIETALNIYKAATDEAIEKAEQDVKQAAKDAKGASDAIKAAETALQVGDGEFADAIADIKGAAVDAQHDADNANNVANKIIAGLNSSAAAIQNDVAQLRSDATTAGQKAETARQNAETALGRANEVNGIATAAKNAADNAAADLKASKPRYATSTNLGTTQAKTATLDPTETNYAPANGATVIVRFTNKLNVDSPTLNVGGSGAKPMVDEKGEALTKDSGAAWAAGEAVVFVYDGTSWVAQGAALKVQQHTDITQTDEAITLSAVRSLVNTGRNISPFFEADFPQEGTSDDYWAVLTKSSITRLGDGWAKVTVDNREGESTAYANFAVKADESASNAQSLTMLVEIKGFSKTGSGNAPYVYANPGATEARTPQFGGAGSDDISGNGEIRRRLNATNNADPNTFTRTTFGIPAGTKATFTARVSVYEDGADSGGNRVGYTAAWKPYSGGIVYTTKAELSVTASEIESSVKEYFEDPTTGVLKNYSTISQTSDAISTAVSAESDKRKATYGNCTTAAETAAKVVSCSNFELYSGAMIAVRFENGNSAASPTLNVNNTGAKSVLVNGDSTPAANKVNWSAYATCNFVYGGGYWRFLGSDEEVKKQLSAESRIDQTATSITSLVAMNNTYTAPDGTSATNTIKSNIDQTAGSITSLVSMVDTYTAPDGTTQTNTIATTVTQTAAAIETRFHDFMASGANILLDTDVDTMSAVNAPYPRARDTRTGVTVDFATMQNPPVKGLRYAHRWQITAEAATGWMAYAFYNRVSGTEQHGFRLTAGKKYTVGCWVYGGYANRAKGRLRLYSTTDDGDSESATCVSYQFDVKLGWNWYQAWGECPETRTYRALFDVNPQGQAVTVNMCGFTLVEGVPSGEYDTLIRETSAGIEVGKVDSSGTNVGARSLVSSLGAFQVYDESDNMLAQLTGSVAQIGRSNQNHLLADSNGVYFYSGSETEANVLGGFNGTTAQIGKKSSKHIGISSNGIEIWNGAEGTASNSLGVWDGNRVRIGKESGAHVVVGTQDNVAAIHLRGYLSGTAYENATITSTQITLGRTDHGHLTTNTNGLYIYDKNGAAKASFTATGALLGDGNGWNTIVKSDGMEILNGSTPHTQISGNYARIGNPSSYHVTLTSSTNNTTGSAGIAMIGSDGAQLANLVNSSLTLGRTDQPHMVAGSSSLSFYEATPSGGSDGNANRLAYFTGDALRIGRYVSGEMYLNVTASGISMRQKTDSGYIEKAFFGGSAVRLGRENNNSYNVLAGTDDKGTETTSDDATGVFIRKGTTVLASMTDSEITMGKADGRNVAITSSAVDICNGSTVLSTFQNNLIELGKNSSAAAIKMCNDSVRISSNSTYGMAVLAPDSGIALQAKKESFVSEIKPEALLFLNPGATSKAQLNAHNESTQTYAEIVLEASNTKSSITIGTGVYGETPRRGELADWVVDDYTSTSSGYGTTANTSTVHWRKWASGRLECERTWFGSRTVQTAYTPATGVTFYTTASAQQTFNWGDTKGNTDSYYGFVTVDSFTVDVRPADGTGLVWSEVYEWATTNSRNHISGGKAYIFSLYSIAAKNYYVTQKIVGYWK